MANEEKFRLPRPTKEQLTNLTDLVNEIINYIRQDSLLVNEKIKELNKQLTKPIDAKEVICSINGPHSQEKFIESLLIPYPSKHIDLSDNELLWLIRKIQKNLSDPFLTGYYSQILDINTSSPTGSTKLLIHQKMTPEKLLENLKENRKKVIRL